MTVSFSVSSKTVDEFNRVAIIITLDINRFVHVRINDVIRRERNGALAPPGKT